MEKKTTIIVFFTILTLIILFFFKKDIIYNYNNFHYKYFLKENVNDEIIIKNINDNIFNKSHQTYPKIQLDRLSKNVSKNQFHDYYQNLQNYLNSDQILKITRKININFQKNCNKDKNNCRKEFLSLFGYHNFLDKNQINMELVSEKKIGPYLLKKFKLYDELGFYMPILNLKKIEGIENYKGNVIAIHGRSSSPDLILGLDKIDYSRALGKAWADAGYDVFAPLVQNGTGLDFRILGFSPHGYDLFQLNNLLNYIDNTSEQKIILTGISYGAMLAEALTILDQEDKIFTTISIQSRFAVIDWIRSQSFSKNYKLSKLKGRGENNSDMFSDYFTSFYHGYLVYYLIHPKKLIISLSSEPIKKHKFFNPKEKNEYFIKILNMYSNSNNINNFKLNYFIGEHEADPLNEIDLFEDYFSNN